MSQSGRVEYRIQSQWDGRPVTHEPVVLQFNSIPDGVELHVEAPFFDDPKNPGGTPGQPFPNLWEFEVIEAFFLNDKTQYLELEVCPHGQHLVLLLEGCRNAIKDKLPMEYHACIDGQKWSGTAKIPAKYFPPRVNKLNCYAIHGSGEDRMYESLYPVPQGKYEQPDFHRLEYFQRINFAELLPQNDSDGASEYWTK